MTKTLPPPLLIRQDCEARLSFFFYCGYGYGECSRTVPHLCQMPFHFRRLQAAFIAGWLTTRGVQRGLHLYTIKCYLVCMRFAIVSDLHANLQAWNAVFLDLRSNGATAIVCLGDVVGYGPQPAAVLQAAHQHVNHFVLGNHDAVVCGKLDATLFNDAARELIGWTREQLGGNAVRFLASLPLTLTGDGFRCTHGAFANPAAFPYVLTRADASASWAQVPEPLLFVGHTHEPAFYLLGPSRTPHCVEPQDFVIEDGKRYLVNVGSVGSPRDGDARASYCLYDTDQRAVYWRRVPFDLDAYRDAVRQAGISDQPNYFLHHDPRAGRRPIRELLNFSPPATPDRAAKGVVEVQAITRLRRRLTAWRTGFFLLLLAAGIGATLGSRAVWRHRTRTATLAPPSFVAVDARTVEPGCNFALLPDTPTPAGQPVPGWMLRLGNRHQQRVAATRLEDGTLALELTSSDPNAPLDAALPPIAVQPGMVFHPDALFRKDRTFAGSVALVVSLTRTLDGREDHVDQFYVKEPNQPKGDGWMRARQKFDIPAGGSSIQFHIHGCFKGNVQVKGLELKRR